MISISTILEPYTKLLNDGLLEVQAKAEKDIGRSIYCDSNSF